MMTSLADTLPPEILNLIFRDLSLRDFSILSRVTRIWQAVAFPYLYHTVYLARILDVDRLAGRMSKNDSPLSVRTHLRNLVVDEGPKREYFHGYHPPYHFGYLAPLTTVLFNASHLQHVSWELRYPPPIHPITEILRTQCPSVLSVRIFVDWRNYYLGFRIQTLVIDNVRHISLHMTCLRRLAMIEREIKKYFDFLANL